MLLPFVWVTWGDPQTRHKAGGGTRAPALHAGDGNWENFGAKSHLGSRHFSKHEVNKMGIIAPHY